MTETKTLTTHVQGKIIQLDYDFITSLNGRCSYCLTDAQVQMILSITDYYGWSTRWYSADGLIDQSVINNLQGGLIEALMCGCCPDNSILSRYTPNGHYQQSSDGGATYTDAPASDPRNPQPYFPTFIPDGTVDNSCMFADSIVNLIMNQLVANLASDATAAQIIEVIISTVSALMGALATSVVGVLVALFMGAIAILIVTFTVPLFQAAMTSEVWDRLRCNISEHVEADGTFTQADIDAIYAQISSDETGIAAIFLHGVIAMFSMVGMSNAANAGYGAADADHCCPDLTCPTEWTFFNVTDVVRIDGNHYTSTYTADGSHVAFTSGDSAVGCYFNPPIGSYTYWPLGSASPVGGTNPRVTRIWNADLGMDWATGEFDFEFSDTPFP